MTATLTPTTQADRCVPNPPLWRAGLAAGIAAAAATVAVAALARSLHVSPEAAPGEAVPVFGFGQLTLFFTAMGVLIARAIGQRAGRPRATFTKVTIALTAASLVPDAILSAGTATKAAFMLTHLVAAAFVIPALARHLPERRP